MNVWIRPQKTIDCVMTRKKGFATAGAPSASCANCTACSRISDAGEEASLFFCTLISRTHLMLLITEPFSMLEACGFPASDVDLFRRLYTGSFLVMVNRFGSSAAVILCRGVPQGAQPSPKVFTITFDPVHVIVRACKRGCSLQPDLDPLGSSGFADDSLLHTDGPDAIPAMAILVPAVADYIRWAGMDVNLTKSGISATDFRTGRQVATDSVTLNGHPFPVIPPDRPHKHLGVRMTMTGDFSAEKDYIRNEMRKRLQALCEDPLLSILEKELVIKIVVCSVFRYSAGLVDWSRTELDSITAMWNRAYKQAWALPRSLDGSPMLLDHSEAGRGCPSATAIWLREVLDVLEQCVSLPGVISQIVRRHLQQLCISHGCHTLNQLQQLLRVRGRADTVLELFLLRLDEQGLEISSPWPPCADQSIAAVLWPRLYPAWLEKERWSGCRELDEDVQSEWGKVQLCLQACRKLGNAEPAILTLTQLRGHHAGWLQVSELRRRRCQLSSAEYSALVSWLPSPAEYSNTSNLSQPEYMSSPVASSLGHTTSRCPPCILGQIVDTVDFNQLVLQPVPTLDLPDVDISTIPDQMLAEYLCLRRAVFPFPRSDDNILMVECLTQLCQVVEPYVFRQEYIVARPACDESAPLTVMSLALVRDCLRGTSGEGLREVCSRPQWKVSSADFYAGVFVARAETDHIAPGWRLNAGGPHGQTTMVNVVQSISMRRTLAVPRPVVPPHPWQADPPLPSRVVIDTSHHHPLQLSSPEGWLVLQRNGRVWITEHNRRVARLDAAQYGMLLTMSGGQPTAEFLQHVCWSCQAQWEIDRDHFVPWSRHLLAGIREITGSELLVGASAVTFNPHFLFFLSPFSGVYQLFSSWTRLCLFPVLRC